MKCDNCEAQVRDGERYCPECGMELLVPKHKPSNYRKSGYKGKGYKKSDYKGKGYKGSDYEGKGYKNSDYKKSGYKKSGYKRSPYKPLQRRYMKGEYREGEYYEGERRDYDEGSLQGDDYYGPGKADQKNGYDQEEPKKSGGLLFIAVVLLIALGVGLLIGLMMFSIPQSIPSIPINQS